MSEWSDKQVRRRAWRQRLWDEQNGLCHWCAGPMVLPEKYPDGGVVKKDFATFEHLVPRNLRRDLTMTTRQYDRIVLAHYGCNRSYNNFVQRQPHIKALQREQNLARFPDELGP